MKSSEISPEREQRPCMWPYLSPREFLILCMRSMTRSLQGRRRVKTGHY